MEVFDLTVDMGIYEVLEVILKFKSWSQNFCNMTFQLYKLHIEEQTQRRIWHQFRMHFLSLLLHRMSLGSSTVHVIEFQLF